MLIARNLFFYWRSFVFAEGAAEERNTMGERERRDPAAACCVLANCRRLTNHLLARGMTECSVIVAALLLLCVASWIIFSRW